MLSVGNILVFGHSSCAGIQTLMSMQDDVDSRFGYTIMVSIKSVLFTQFIIPVHFSFQKLC
jgi:carbonic anhydrase